MRLHSVCNLYNYLSLSLYSYSNILIIFAIVLDPRLKLEYFKNHSWEQRYIDAAKNHIVRVYKERYAPNDCGSSVQHDILEDSFLLHIYKRRRIENENELDQYLKAPLLLSVKTDILQWWKVTFCLQ